MVQETRATFFSRITPLFAPQTVWSVELAYTLSKYGHRAQVRQETDEEGRPLRYFEHPRRVAIILLDEARCARPEMIIAALLHDALEDTRDITAEMLAHWFDPDTACLVKMLSKVPKEGYMERLLSFGDWRVLLIKACDRLDNIRSLHCATPEFVRKQLDETKAVYFGLLDRMVDLTPSEHLAGAKRIRKDLRSMVRKLDKGAAARSKAAVPSNRKKPR